MAFEADSLTHDEQIETVDNCLPQTQCRDCGYQGCKPYAEAMVKAQAPIDLCKPGGEPVLKRLAQVFDLDPNDYLAQVLQQVKPYAKAVIQSDVCIACVKCVRVCPADAIVGAGKASHEVIADRCHGCGLCLPVCPVDCIELTEPKPWTETMLNQLSAGFKRWHVQKQRRLRQQSQAKKQAYLKRLAQINSVGS